MTPGMTTRHRRATTGSRHRRRTGSSPASPRPRPMWLPDRNRATGTTSPCRSMTAATTGGILPRAADVLCGSSPELPHFSFPAASGHRACPGTAAHTARTGPALTARHRGKDFGRTKIFPAMTHLYKIFFLLHNVLDPQRFPPSGKPEACHICASHRHSRDALRSNPILGRVAFFCPRPARTPPSRPLRHAAERAMIPDLPGNAAPARPVPGGMSGMPSA